MSTREHYYTGEDGKGRYRNLYGMGLDLDRLRELTGPYIADGDSDDYAPALARIPDEAQRQEAEELIGRLTPFIGPKQDEAIAATQDPGGGLHSA
jgi:hypothetical protein